ncbi:protocadherin-15 isoform X8 [Dicentrarchus labrax]|uniref:protocadherin-15 isoform X8 n=1 Tax=Dicentrarchus labrax TaxID=13489 RepID=UPI0021F5F858|nr:protocadherin-15 isoform X8 [Dicentrarchus labrax]
MLRPCRLLLWQVALRLSYHVVTASLCLGGSDIFSSVRENSPMGEFIANLNVRGEPGTSAVRLCLTGEYADWFYLEGRTIRLNTSASRVLDREVLGSVLIAELTCYEDDVIQSQYRIVVEIVNENDNKPHFLEETIPPFTVNELTAVNSVVFSVKAVDADGDMISYIIDQSSRDAWFFRIDLPNSGNVVLNKALDYETRTQLQVIIWAQEANTVEKFNMSTVLTVNIEDGDDQYPYFLPCTPVSPAVPVCMSPTYTANITHKQQDVVLEFSPGPIRAEDGDRGVNTPLTFSILSGGDRGRFVINNSTGEIRLTRPVNSQPMMTNFTLTVMVCQVNDRLKYSVASALVRVLSENMFPPVFNRTTFKGFIIQSSSPASIVSTYGNQVLQVQVSDRDFTDGRNPNIHYSLHPPSGLYQITQGGVLIARTDQLHAFDRHILQVVARDEESGDEVSASVDIEVLQRGQQVPRGAFTEQPLFGDVDSRLAGGIAAMILLLFLSSALFLLLRTVRRRRQRNADEHTPVALGKHPNVTLSWFHTVSSSRPAFSADESPFSSRSFRQQSSSKSGSFHGRQGVYTRRQSLLPPPSSSPSSPSSSNISSVPGGRSRPHTDLFPVPEKPEGQPEDTETLRFYDTRGGVQGPGGDITAETLRETTT